MPGGESADDVLARYLPVLRALVAEDSAFPLDDAHASSDSASTRGPADATGSASTRGSADATGSASTRGSADALDSSNSRDGGRNIVVVSHGAAIRLIAQHLANIEGQFIFDNPLPNAARVELVRDIDAGNGDKAGSWKLARWGEKSNEPEAE